MAGGDLTPGGVGYGGYTIYPSYGVVFSGTNYCSSVQHNFESCSFDYVYTGVQYGDYVEGLVFNQCAFVGGAYALKLIAPAHHSDAVQFMNCNTNVLNYAIWCQDEVRNIYIVGNLFLVVPSGQGIVISGAGSSYAITGNMFQSILLTPSSNGGIVIQNNSTGGIITGNVLDTLATGIWLQSTTSGANVQSNKYISCTTNVLNSGGGNTVGGGSE